MPNNPLKAVEALIQDGALDQTLVESVQNWPLLHFSEHATAIAREGFRFGEANAHRLDYTYDHGGFIKSHTGAGYNFAFNAVAWDVENEVMDYEVASGLTDRTLQGMYERSAILFLGSGLYVRHFDEFHQVILWGPEVKTQPSLLLTNLGAQSTESGEEVCDDNGNPVDCWVLSDAGGNMLVKAEDYLTLRECVVKGLLHFDQLGLLSAEASKAIKELYQGEIEDLDRLSGEV